MFWKKDKNALPGPKGLPETLLAAISLQYWGATLTGLEQFQGCNTPKEEKQDTFDVRVFNEVRHPHKRITVKDYNSLTDHARIDLVRKRLVY